MKNIFEDVKTETENIAEAALRYITSFNAVTSVIPGMRSDRNLLANCKAVEKGKLSGAALEKLKAHRWVRNFYA